MLPVRLNLACWVTISRLALLPVALLPVSLHWPHGLLIAAVACAAAGLSDSLDGYLARRSNSTSSLGSILDLLADKLFVSATMIALASQGIIPYWMPGIVIFREIAISIMRYRRVAEKKAIGPDRWGKAKTVVTMLAVTGLFLRQGINQDGIVALTSISLPISWVLDSAWWAMLLAVALTVFSGANYFASYTNLYGRRHNP